MQKETKRKIIQTAVIAALVAYNVIRVEQIRNEKPTVHVHPTPVTVNAPENCCCQLPKKVVVKPKKKVEEKVRILPVEKEIVIVKQKEERKNRVRVMGGSGVSKKLNVEQLASGDLRIDTTREFVWGVGYSRQLTERCSVTGEVLSNETYLLGLEFDF